MYTTLISCSLASLSTARADLEIFRAAVSHTSPETAGALNFVGVEPNWGIRTGDHPR